MPATLVGRQGRVVAARPVVDAPDEAPALGASLLAACRWMAEYYASPSAWRCAPRCRGAHRRGAPRADRAPPARRQHPPHVESLLHRERIFARAPQQRALYELLEGTGGRAAVSHLLEHLRFSPSVLKGLVARGLVEVRDEVVARDPFATRAGVAQDHRPSAAQATPSPR
jgi:primosomal protein N'